MRHEAEHTLSVMTLQIFNVPQTKSVFHMHVFSLTTPVITFPLLIYTEAQLLWSQLIRCFAAFKQKQRAVIKYEMWRKESGVVFS